MDLELLKYRFIKPRHDFLDLGCKKGGSIHWCTRKYGGIGLGVDLNQEWIDEAKKSGYDAICADVLNLNFPKNSFRYVGMIDFLEHLPTKDDAIHVLKNCKKWATDFFFIHHPSFEGSDYLKERGLKVDWTDGYNHTCPLTIKDFNKIFKDLGLNNYTIKPMFLIENSQHPHVVPVDAPHDTHLYSKSLGPKKKIEFQPPIPGRLEILVKLK